MPITSWSRLGRQTVEFRHLRALPAIADERNLTRAAARLHFTLHLAWPDPPSHPAVTDFVGLAHAVVTGR